jgi:hypothetical protein
MSEISVEPLLVNLTWTAVGYLETFDPIEAFVQDSARYSRYIRSLKGRVRQTFFCQAVSDVRW